jgi:hypothetical protein
MHQHALIIKKQPLRQYDTHMASGYQPLHLYAPNIDAGDMARRRGVAV